jgi:hypothetical protein
MMNTDFNSGGIMYKAAAFAIFIILVVLIILISVSSSKSNGNMKLESTSTIETNTPETSAVSVSVTEKPDSEPVQTTETVQSQTAEVTTVSVTTPAESDKPVNIPTGNTPDEIADYLAKYPNTVLSESKDAGQEYIDKLVFLGDSTTYGLRFYKKLNGGKDTTQVWTPVSGTLTLSQASFAKILYPETNTEITIKEVIEAKKPEYLVITLGVNGVSFMGEDYFKSEYKKLIESASKNYKKASKAIARIG